MAQVWDDDEQAHGEGWTAEEIPDRTPPSKVWCYTGKRIDQRCVICGAAYLIAPTYARHYHTCSRACTFALHSQQRTGRPWSTSRRAAAGNEGRPRRIRWER